MSSLGVKLLVSAVLFTSFAYAQDKCSRVFLLKDNGASPFAVEKILSIEYVKDFVLNENKKYVVTEVTNRGPVLNQDSLGLCHLYSLEAELTREYKQRHNDQDPNIAIYYNAFHHWYNRALETALSSDKSLDVPEGGWYNTTFRMIKDVGLMQDSRYESLGGRTDVESRYKSEIEHGQLKRLMLSSKSQLWTIDSILKNDFPNLKARQKYLQELYMQGDNEVLSTLNQLVSEKSKALKKGETALTNDDIQLLKDLSKGYLRAASLSLEQIAGLKSRIRQDITRDVQKLFAAMFFDRSELPEEMLDTRKAVQLSKEMFPEMHQSTLSIEVSEGRGFGPVRFLERTKPDELRFDAPIETLAEIIANQVEQNNNGVWLGYDHNGKFVDNASGAMTLRGFSWKPFNSYINRKWRNLLSIYDGGHAVQVIGTIRAQPTEKQKAAGLPGELLGFEIQNSWGDKVGRSGIFTMDIDYFKAFAFVITIRDEVGQFANSGLPQKVEKGKGPTFSKDLFFKRKH